MSIAVIPGSGSVFDPTRQILKNTTIIQKSLLDMLIFGSKEYQIIFNSSPGTEIKRFNRILQTKKDDLLITDDRGFSKKFTTPKTQILKPDDFFRLTITRYLAIAYERASRKDIELRNAIMNLKTDVYLMDPNRKTKKSFMYDGYKQDSELKKFKDPMMILSNALKRAKDAIGKSVTVGLEPITPSQVQKQLIEGFEKTLDMKYVDKDMVLNEDVSIQDTFSIATQFNRSYLKATHPRMILPEKPSNIQVIQTERFGTKISLTTNIPDFEETIYTDEEEALVEYLTDSMEKPSFDITYSGKGTGYEMKTFLSFGKKRYELTPLLS